jgi:hypothetical protein
MKIRDVREVSRITAGAYDLEPRNSAQSVNTLNKNCWEVDTSSFRTHILMQNKEKKETT